MSIQLTTEETILRDKIVVLMEKIKKKFDQFSIGNEVHEFIEEAGTLSHQLHMSLKERNHEPRHHKYMVKNRELAVEHPDFYKHVHPIEDLLKFLDNEKANDDPVDQTIGCEFKFEIYTRRWEHNDIYTIKRTQDGWHVSFKMINGPCDKGGNPFLYRNFDQDSVSYPSGLEYWLESLWNQAESKGLSQVEVQQALDELAKWVVVTEKNAPSGGVWGDY
ncbi:MAG: hypothetical protein B9S32_12840 [Verrucomicrobia bacterium Tous-C9LFEB]|nr:MAG: hypothetical protein B9S32_12840 [Verrucomicrobia bacterium Tous-C9LFEB]